MLCQCCAVWPSYLQPLAISSQPTAPWAQALFFPDLLEMCENLTPAAHLLSLAAKSASPTVHASTAFPFPVTVIAPVCTLGSSRVTHSVKIGIFFCPGESAAWWDSWSSPWDSSVSVHAGPRDEQDPVPGSLLVSSANQDTECWDFQWVICVWYGCLVFLSCSHFRWTIVSYQESLSASLLQAFWVNSSSFALVNFLLFLLTIF